MTVNFDKVVQFIGDEATKCYTHFQAMSSKKKMETVLKTAGIAFFAGLVFGPTVTFIAAVIAFHSMTSNRSGYDKTADFIKNLINPIADVIKKHKRSASI